MFDERFGARARASDAAWAESLSPAARLALVEELLEAVRSAHTAAGDWHIVDERAWNDSLAERRRAVAAFHRLDEVRGGWSPPADAG